MQVVGQPIHISLHVGRLSIQAKQSEVEATQELSWAPTTSTPGSREDNREALSKLHELMLPVWGPTSHVN
jgi:hypothetical protein